MALERRQRRRAREALGLVVERDAPRRRRQPLDQRRERARAGAARVRGASSVGHVGVVAAEQLVAALAGERDLHVLVRRAARRGRSAAPTSPRTARRTPPRSRAAARRRRAARRARGGRSRSARATSARRASSSNDALLEADRERLDRARGSPRGQRRQRRRVDAAGEQHADGTSATRCARTESRRRVAQLVGERRRARARTSRGREPARARVALDPRRGRPRRRSKWPGGSLRDARGRSCSGAGIAVEREERLERVEVELARRSRAARSERLRAPTRTAERRRATRVVERLDPEAVAREHEPARAARPTARSANMPRSRSAKLEAALLVEVHEHLGVAVACGTGGPRASSSSRSCAWL